MARSELLTFARRSGAHLRALTALSADRYGVQVAGYRRPADVVVVDEFPRGTDGELDRAGATEVAAQTLATGGSA